MALSGIGWSAPAGMSTCIFATLYTDAVTLLETAGSERT